MYPSDGADDDKFCRLAGNDQCLVIGAYNNNSTGVDAGAAYIFEYDSGVWTEQTKLVGSNLTSGDGFGFSVSMDGDYIAVGAMCASSNGTDSGAAYIYKKNGDNWVEQAYIYPDDGEAGENFGISVKLSGDMLLIGSQVDSYPTYRSGSVYFYQKSDTLWTLAQKFVGEDHPLEGLFGEVIDIEGNTAIIGCRGDSSIQQYAGSVYIFEYTDVANDQSTINYCDNNIQSIYPNPFNPETKIEYSIKENSQVEISIYNIKGQKVKTLVNDNIDAGDRSVIWHGDTDSGNNVSSGVYFVKMTTGNHTETRKLVLMK